MDSRRRDGRRGPGERPVLTAAAARERARRALRARLAHLVVETDGNVAEIARRMGKDRSTVRYHLDRFGLLGATDPSACRGEDSGDRESGRGLRP